MRALGGCRFGEARIMTDTPTPPNIADALRFLQRQTDGNALLSVPLCRLAVHIERQAKELKRLNASLEQAFDAGFTVCATEWARRDDLIADIGAPAYVADRGRALEFLGLTAEVQGTASPDSDQMLAVFAQVDAIHRIEGFEPTELQRRIRAAILAGRITSAQAAREMSAYAAERHTLDGFIASRPWLNTTAG